MRKILSESPHFSDEETLLDRLLSASSDSPIAWKEFLRRYSNHFLKIIWKYEKDYDEVMEKYLFICSKIAQNDCAILRRFRIERPGFGSPKFTTWICTVVQNLCIDAHRVKHGRRRLPRAIEVLSPLQKEVFKLYFWKGLSVEEINSILGEAGRKRSMSLSSIISSIEQGFAYSSNGRARGTEGLSFVPYNDQVAYTEDQERELTESLNEWMAAITEEEQAVLRLRFWENMSVKEIARLLRIQPERKVSRIVGKALKVLRKNALSEAG